MLQTTPYAKNSIFIDKKQQAAQGRSSVRPVCLFFVPFFSQLFQEGQEEGHRDAEGEGIGDGLAQLDAGQAPDAGQGEDEGDEADSLTAAGEEGGPARFADGLEHHVGDDDDRLQEHGDALIPQSGQGHGGDGGVVAEEADERLGVEPAEEVQHRDEAEGR